MPIYQITQYQPGVEAEQARIGIEASRDWVWPFAHDEQGWFHLHQSPDFDPDLSFFAWGDGAMVGHLTFFPQPAAPDSPDRVTVFMEFPRVLPGHPDAAQSLIIHAEQALRQKGIGHITGRLSTMNPQELPVMEKLGYTLRDRGYKLYYVYPMEQGRIDHPALAQVAPVRFPDDLDEAAALAARWYHRPAAWCREHLVEWHREGIISHYCIRSTSEMIAACLTAVNENRPVTAANYSIYTPDSTTLEPLLAAAVNACITHGIRELVADLVNEHRPYEDTYQKLGFQKAAEWVNFEKNLV
ncbi:MAG: hypothetical protein HPY85_11480 [Anaerolineae bacterium]|nr:hypothetical protein [Anaerolineae bacterium]